MTQRPANVRYTPTHEWVRLEGDTAVVGITDFAVEHLGELVFVDLPPKGKKLGKGEILASVESVKAVGDVYTPVGGEIAEANAGLANDQQPLAKDPYGTGWIAKIRVPADTKLDGLMDLGAYAKHIETAGGGH